MECGSVAHVEKVHRDVIRLVGEIARGKFKLKEKLGLLRDKFPPYFQSIALYNAVVSKLNVNDVIVPNRQLIHELFDWCKEVDGAGENQRLFFSEIEKISQNLIAILQRKFEKPNSNLKPVEEPTSETGNL